jgi:hypothetical protein
LGERELAALAHRQHGVVSRQQLLDHGVRAEAITYRLKVGRLHSVHRGVYALGHSRLPQRGVWLAAVLACGDRALLSHHHAAALWGLTRGGGRPIHVSSSTRHVRQGLVIHRGNIHEEDRARVDEIPVTSISRTLLDLAEVVDAQRLARIFEEADRLRLLELRAVERACDRGRGRRGVAAVRKLIAAAREPETPGSPLEQRFAEFCQEVGVPLPVFNTTVLGFQVDALWPRARLMVELDGYASHRHRAAFERDRTRDALMQVADYRIIRLTHRRLDEEKENVERELRSLLGRGRDGRGSGG